MADKKVKTTEEVNREIIDKLKELSALVKVVRYKIESVTRPKSK